MLLVNVAWPDTAGLGAEGQSAPRASNDGGDGIKVSRWMMEFFYLGRRAPETFVLFLFFTSVVVFRVSDLNGVN